MGANQYSIEFRKTADHAEIYCNSAHTSVTAWDFAISLGTIDRSGSGVVFDRATVIMSPAHAKALAGILATDVAAYEANFGKIPMPSEGVPQATIPVLPN